jgi:hypothetical protein
VCTELGKVATRKFPGDKLHFIENCCTALFNASPAPLSGDDFLSLLVYAVIRSNPPRLYSHVQFISRYGDRDALSTGKSAYCFTSLVCLGVCSELSAERAPLRLAHTHHVEPQLQLYRNHVELALSADVHGPTTAA